MARWPKLAVVPASHRWLAAALATLALGVAGCSSFDAALGKQEAVVRFQPQTSRAAMMRVRAACSHVPSAKPEAVPTHLPAVDAGYSIRYLVSNASDADLARLQQCLQRFRSVAGIEFVTPEGS